MFEWKARKNGGGEGKIYGTVFRLMISHRKYLITYIVDVNIGFNLARHLFRMRAPLNEYKSCVVPICFLTD